MIYIIIVATKIINDSIDIKSNFITNVNIIILLTKLDRGNSNEIEYQKHDDEIFGPYKIVKMYLLNWSESL